MSAKRYNLSRFSALIVDGDAHATELLGGMLRAFGLSQQTFVSTGGEAIAKLSEEERFDLILCEAVLDDMAGTDLIRLFRQQATGGIKFAPIIVLTGHTPLSNISGLRDSGAHAILKKPIAPGALFDRIVWAAESTRPFVETETYCGPDRRFRNVPPADGVWRRSTDITSSVGEASEPNLSQVEIDSFMRPAKVSIE
jgi:CheY-like chemotaxis protein